MKMMIADKTKLCLDRISGWCFAPPYKGVPWLVWFYALAAVFACASGGVFTGHFISFDDHVRMLQVLNWINGAGWYDRTIMRANMPEGFTTTWARIVDVPIAAVVIVAQHFTDQRKAALIASVVVPFAELAIVFAAARYFVRPLVGKNKARLVVLFLMFTTILNLKRFTIAGFHTGEASHHPWYIILTLLLFGATSRIAAGATGRAAIGMMAFSIAMQLAVGIECFPLIATSCLMLVGVAWYFERPVVAWRGMLGMALGALGGLVLLPLYQPPDRLLEISFAHVSILGPILIAAAAAYLGATWFITGVFGPHRKISLLNLCVVAAAFAALLVLAFPDILNGPAAGLSPRERKMAFAEHTEVWPLKKVAVNWLDYVCYTAPSLLSLAAGIIALRSTSNRRRRSIYTAYLGFAAITGFITQFLSRYLHHAWPAACAWLLWSWEKIKTHLRPDQNYALKAFGVFIMLGPFWMLLLPGLIEDANIRSKILWYPAKYQLVHDACDTIPLSDYINSHYGKDTVLISPVWDSSRFLYNTDVKLNFLALYPSQDKFIDDENFYQTTNPDEAKDIARRHNIDIVAACRYPQYYEPSLGLDQQMMLGRMQEDKVPDWLKLVSTNVGGAYLLYEVDKNALAQ